MYEHQELKSSILWVISDEFEAMPNWRGYIIALFLEDVVARVKLIGHLTPEALINGLVCAIFGRGLDV